MTEHFNSSKLLYERKKCPVCSQPEPETLLDLDYSSDELKAYIKMEQTFRHDFWDDFNGGCFKQQTFKVVKCKHCGFLFQANVLNNSGMKLLYDKWIDPQATLERHKKLNLPTQKALEYSRRFNIILRNFSGNPDIEVLDWGGGFGDFCAMAKIYDVNITALEFSDERSEHMESRNIPSLTIDKLEKKHYHFINLDQVLEHIVEPVDLLREIHQFLRDDGILYVGAPNCTHAERLLRSGVLSQKLFDCLSLQHINAFTNKTLKKTCRAAGFRVLLTANPQASIFYDRSKWLGSGMEIFKNVVRPLSNYYIGTSLFLTKA